MTRLDDTADAARSPTELHLIPTMTIIPRPKNTFSQPLQGLGERTLCLVDGSESGIWQQRMRMSKTMFNNIT